MYTYLGRILLTISKSTNHQSYTNLAAKESLRAHRDVHRDSGQAADYIFSLTNDHPGTSVQYAWHGSDDLS